MSERRARDLGFGRTVDECGEMSDVESVPDARPACGAAREARSSRVED